jgi:YD repeat-containing protein
MKKLLSFFTLLAVFFVYNSCTPNADDDGDLLLGFNNTGSSGGTSGVNKTLKAITSTDDTGETVTYNYNYNAGQLTSVRTSDNSVSYDLFYENKNINKITVVRNDSTITTTNFTITYTNGNFAGATGIATDNTGASYTNNVTAAYTNNKISKIRSELSAKDPSDPTVTHDLTSLQSDITYTGNNVSTWTLTTSFPPTPPISIPPIIINTTFSDYDTKINPFGTLPKVFNIISTLYGTEGNGVTGLSVNNFRKIAVVTNADTQSATYVYTYDADDYPTKAVASNNLSTLTFQYQ